MKRPYDRRPLRGAFMRSASDSSPLIGRQALSVSGLSVRPSDWKQTR